MIDKNVEHPSHYVWLKDVAWVEVIDIVRHMWFNLWWAVKYILRAWKKKEEWMSDIEKEIQDLSKAVWLINDYIENILKPMMKQKWEIENEDT